VGFGNQLELFLIAALEPQQQKKKEKKKGHIHSYQQHRRENGQLGEDGRRTLSG
jgi:hypothetical protein